MADAATDAAIAARFPREWQRANNPALPNRSKARQQLRQRYRHALEMEALMLANPEARCSSCAHASRNPAPLVKGTICDLDSDFHGYAIVAPDFVCTRWRAAQGIEARQGHDPQGRGAQHESPVA